MGIALSGDAEPRVDADATVALCRTELDLQTTADIQGKSGAGLYREIAAAVDHRVFRGVEVEGNTGAGVLDHPGASEGVEIEFGVGPEKHLPGLTQPKAPLSTFAGEALAR